MSEGLQRGDYYWEDGKMVFTEQYHLKRGKCCGNGCRHCPYKQQEISKIEKQSQMQDWMNDSHKDVRGEERKPHSFCETPEEKCTMNYCDDNGCMNRKRELVDPQPVHATVDDYSDPKAKFAYVIGQARVEYGLNDSEVNEVLATIIAHNCRVANN